MGIAETCHWMWNIVRSDLSVSPSWDLYIRVSEWGEGRVAPYNRVHRLYTVYTPNCMLLHCNQPIYSCMFFYFVSVLSESNWMLCWLLYTSLSCITVSITSVLSIWTWLCTHLCEGTKFSSWWNIDDNHCVFTIYAKIHYLIVLIVVT